MNKIKLAVSEWKKFDKSGTVYRYVITVGVERVESNWIYHSQAAAEQAGRQFIKDLKSVRSISMDYTLENAKKVG